MSKFYLQKCHDCGVIGDSDTLTKRIINHAPTKVTDDTIGVFCDKCLSKYPKADPRDWRREEHPDANGVITWLDGTTSHIDADGIIRDAATHYAEQAGLAAQHVVAGEF